MGGEKREVDEMRKGKGGRRGKTGKEREDEWNIIEMGGLRECVTENFN